MKILDKIESIGKFLPKPIKYKVRLLYIKVKEKVKIDKELRQDIVEFYNKNNDFKANHEGLNKIDRILKQFSIPSGIGTRKGGKAYNFVLQNRLSNCLELGFGCGVSSIYIGAALRKLGGHLYTVDLKTALDRKPNINLLIKLTGLEGYITPIAVNTSYTWYLMELIQKYTKNHKCTPIFDFCFIDGAHSWFVDGFAFFLVDKLLKPGGWILFDDLCWTYSTSPSLKDTDLILRMPTEEKITPQISLVCKLLVKQHPDYQNFKVLPKEDWFLAQKKNIREKS